MATVVSIVKKRGRTAGCIITLDNNETIECSLDLISKHNITKKEDITEEALAAIINDQRMMTARQVALVYATYKTRTSAQVRKKLAEKGYSPEESEATMDFLKEFNYVNDVAYSRAFIEELIKRKPAGKSRITAELKKRGIDVADIKAAIREIFPEDDTLTLARDAATKKLRTVRHKTIDKQRSTVVSFLARQGFAWDIIRKTIEELKLNG